MNTQAYYELPDPKTAPELFDTVLPRRVIAYMIDLTLMVVLSLIIALVVLVSGLMTAGISWLGLPVAIPIAIASYYAMTLGARQRATVGMRAMDLVLTPARGKPLDGWTAFIHPLLFWLTIWISWPISLMFVLFTPRRQMLHDLATGTLMVRRSPMVRHWRGVSMAS